MKPVRESTCPQGFGSRARGLGRPFLLLLLAGVVLGAAPAHAADAESARPSADLLTLAAVADAPPAPATAAPATPSAPAPAQSSAPAPGADAFDFDLMDDKAKVATPEDAAKQAQAAKQAAEIDRQVRIRRKMLLSHQVLGFSTLGVMAATLIIGQLNYVARYGDFHQGRDYDRFQLAHIGLASASSVMFTGLGILGVAAPNPYPKPIRADSALFHKVAMALATAGMVTQLVLGPITTAYEGSLKQRDLALGHVITGYATWGFMAAGIIAYTF